MRGGSVQSALANPAGPAGVQIAMLANRGFRGAPPPAIHGGPHRGPHHTAVNFFNIIQRTRSFKLTAITDDSGKVFTNEKY
jgi:hypothetical protein